MAHRASDPDIMESRESDIVVTGAGVCCNMGDDLAEIGKALRAGKNPPFEKWQVATDVKARCQIIGMYKGDVSDAALGIAKKQSRFMGRASRIALRSALTARDAAKLDTRDVAVVFGSGTGDVDTHIEVRRKLDETGDAKKVLPTVIPKLMASTVSANLVNILKTTGPSFTATAACAGGAYNVLLAAMLLRSGHATAAIAGGVETIDPHFFSGFDAMGAYNGKDNDAPHRASRPYAADRAGFIFGEASGAVVLERRKDAEKRGAPILGTLLGWGMSSDGEGEMVAPAATGALQAMRVALSTTGIGPDAIDYVNTHGTSTPVGDIGEIRAIRELVGGRHVAYSSTKGYTGHSISAAGVIEAIFTMAMLREGWIAPSVHAEPVDPEITDYPPVVAPTDRDLKIALSNSFGFGGTNAALVLGRP